MIRRPPRSTLSSSSAASDVYKRQHLPRRSVIGPPLHCLPSEGGRVVWIPLVPNRVRPGLCHGQVAFDDLGGAQRPLQQRAGIIKVEYAQVVREPQHGERARTTRQEGRLEHRGLPPGEVPEPVSYTHLRAHETPEHLVCRLLLE